MINDVLCIVLGAFTLILLASVIFSWVRAFGRVDPDTTLYRVMRLTEDIVRPVLVPFRKVIPPLRLSSGMAFDLSVLVVFVLLAIVRLRVLRCGSFLGF